MRDIKNLFEHEKEESYYKPVRVTNFWSKNYIEYESNSEDSSIQSSNSPPFPEYSLLDHTWYPTPQLLCDLQGTMPFHQSPSAKDFPRSGNFLRSIMHFYFFRRITFFIAYNNVKLKS